MRDDTMVFYPNVGHGYADWHSRNRVLYVVARFVPLHGEPVRSPDLANMDAARDWLAKEAKRREGQEVGR